MFCPSDLAINNCGFSAIMWARIGNDAPISSILDKEIVFVVCIHHALLYIMSPSACGWVNQSRFDLIE